MKPLSFWGAIRKNLFWGRRSGTQYKGENPGPAFKLKKWANGSNNSGPVGWKAKKAKRGRL